MSSPAVEDLSDREALQLLYDWYGTWARPKQLPPEGEWSTWLILAGRGWGKTRTGAEWIRKQARENPGAQFALVARSPGDARDVMVEGESGLLEVCPPWFRPKYEPSKRRLTWPNGTRAIVFSSFEPDKLRGPQFAGAWCDELASWEKPRETWDNLMFGLRQGTNPRAVVTNTPKPIPLLKELKDRDSTVVTKGSTYENEENLAPSFLESIRADYEDTRLGRQEIHAEILDEAPDALWSHQVIEEHRVKQAPELGRIVVAVDPATTSTKTSDETGIIVAGTASITEEGCKSRKHGTQYGYVLEDATCSRSPEGWGSKVITLFYKHGADCVVYEANQGGDMVDDVLQSVSDSVTLPTKAVHATRGKHIRAEPVSALYERGRIHHVGAFPKLEEQLCTWQPGDDSPDRLDALVWAFQRLMVSKQARQVVW